MRRRRSHHAPGSGQASIEYLLLVTVAVVLLAVAGTLVGAPSITNAVGRQLRHALCTVTGGRCATVDPAPCVLHAGSLRGSVGATLAVVGIGRGIAVLRVERSDGTIDVTLLDELRAGVETGVGATGAIDLGRRTLGAGGMVEAQIVAALGGGTTWRVRSRAAADRLQRALAEVVAGREASRAPGVGGLLGVGQRLLGVGAGRRLPEPRARSISAKAGAELRAALGSSAVIAASGSALIGAQRLRDGTLIASFVVDGSAGLELAAGAGVVGTRGSTGLTVSFDAEGRPLTAVVSGVGTLAGRVRPPAPAVDRGGTTTSRQVRVQATLDLTDPASATAVRRVLGGLRPGHVGELGEAAAGLAATLASEAALDVGLYRSSTRAYGASIEAALGGKAGIELDVELESATLDAAWSRPPAGAWERRLDCVG